MTDRMDRMDRIFYSDLVAEHKRVMTLAEQLESANEQDEYDKIIDSLNTSGKRYMDFFYRWEKLFPEARHIVPSPDDVTRLLMDMTINRDKKFGNCREAAYNYLESRTDADTVQFVKTNIWRLEKLQEEDDIVGIIYHIAHCRGLKDDVCIALPNSTNYVSIRSVLEGTN